MIKAYHCTNSKDEILKDGHIFPMRMDCIYLFADKGDAENYCKEFDRKDIIDVGIDPKQIESRWKPSYAPNGVIRLKPHEIISLRVV